MAIDNIDDLVTDPDDGSIDTGNGEELDVNAGTGDDGAAPRGEQDGTDKVPEGYVPEEELRNAHKGMTQAFQTVAELKREIESLRQELHSNTKDDDDDLNFDELFKGDSDDDEGYDSGGVTFKTKDDFIEAVRRVNKMEMARKEQEQKKEISSKWSAQLEFLTEADMINDDTYERMVTHLSTHPELNNDPKGVIKLFKAVTGGSPPASKKAEGNKDVVPNDEEAQRKAEMKRVMAMSGGRKAPKKPANSGNGVITGIDSLANFLVGGEEG